MPDGEAYPHLPLIKENLEEDRRKRQPPGSPIFRPEGRGGFGAAIKKHIDRISDEKAKLPKPPEGFQPHLILRVPFAQGQRAPIPSIVTAFEKAGYTIVSMEANRAIVAFKDDSDLTGFRKMCDGYAAGPRDGINPDTGEPYKSTQWDILEYIDPAAIRNWTREDRVGADLAEAIGPSGERLDPTALYRVDVDVWHTGDIAQTRLLLGELKASLLKDPDASEKVIDEHVGDYICYARLLVRGRRLHALLDAPAIAGIELPPKPRFNTALPRAAGVQDFPPPVKPTRPGPSVCVVDSGVSTSHPLLAPFVGYAQSILTKTGTAADEHGHGTMVGSLAVFGDIFAAYESKNFASQVTLFSARVLNDQNTFDDDQLVIHQIKKAIEAFTIEPYSCRVFNLSLGTDRPAPQLREDRQSAWAEALDTLAKDLGVLLVVSAGNYEERLNTTGGLAEEAYKNYPNYLFEPKARLSDPATASIALTVGSLAHEFNARTEGDDVKLAIAHKDEPSPFTRTGPGVNDAIKPDLVHYGGNMMLGPAGQDRGSYIDEEVSVLGLHHKSKETLFAFDAGTSFASPRVARLAALAWYRLESLWPEIDPEDSEGPTANLVRALLANSASIPQATKDRLKDSTVKDAVRKAVGYGIPDEERVLGSTPKRVTLVAKGDIGLDKFHVFEIPLPDEIMSVHGKKHVTISLAYDPPVRARRQPYLGVGMTFYMIGGANLDEVVEKYKKLDKDEDDSEQEEDELKAFTFNAGEPGVNARRWSTLQRATKSFTKKRDVGQKYYLVVRCERRWAPPTVEKQDFAIVVTIEADDERLYQLVEAQIRLRQPARVRV